MKYSDFVESLKRLYAARKLTEKKLGEFLASGRITQEEFFYIIKGEV